MNQTPASVEELTTLLATVRAKLSEAQEILDRTVPDSILGARLQHVLDDLDTVTLKDIVKGRHGGRID